MMPVEYKIIWGLFLLFCGIGLLELHLIRKIFKALLVIRKPLEKCAHINVDMKQSIKDGESWYKCLDCGIGVKPATYEPA